ncbi:hypothetical protein K7X08_035856 [Anisodus acutangulus]|uniref:Uncharacterized protein n=1 Tax=Anisodus acutangulus TaxID=402998 RepID=A0A9Q1L5Q0_9SOLA|nr:hypothetical protein K7X08_035856 [Anisodus acutangulus]
MEGSHQEQSQLHKERKRSYKGCHQPIQKFVLKVLSSGNVVTYPRLKNNKGNVQQSRGTRVNENVKKTCNVSKLNKGDTDKIVNTNKFNVLSTVNKEEETCKVNHALEEDDSNKDDVNKEILNTQDIEDNADQSLELTTMLPSKNVVKEEYPIFVEVVQTSSEDNMAISNNEGVEDVATQAGDSLDSEELEIPSQNGDSSPKIVTSVSENNMSMVEQVGNGRTHEEALEVSRNAEIRVEDVISEHINSPKVNISNEEFQSNLTHLDDQEEIVVDSSSGTSFKVQLINKEGGVDETTIEKQYMAM